MAISERRPRTELAASDFGLSLLIVLLVSLLTERREIFETSTILIGVGGVAGLLLSLWWRNSYLPSRNFNWALDIAMLFRSVVPVSVGMVLVPWFFSTHTPRLWVLIVSVSWLLVLSTLRFLAATRGSIVAKPVSVIVAGNTMDALGVRLALRSDPRTRYEVHGFVMDSLDDEAPELVSRLALGSIDQLPHVVKRSNVDMVVICLGAVDAARFAPLSRALNTLGVDVALSTGLGHIALRRVELTYASGRPLVRITPARRTHGHLAIKRSVDIIGALVLSVVSAPVMMLAAIGIWLQDRKSPIFKQVRVGKDGKHFTIYKFRTMVQDAESMILDLTNDHEGPVFKMRDDPRITRVGSLLRKTSIDELPQLFNILKGEMSLVGPRPLPVGEVEAAPDSFLDRQVVKPGLTGRWQVSGRSDTDFEQLDELDRWYVDNWSLGQDLEILAKTLPAVLMARGAR